MLRLARPDDASAVAAIVNDPANLEKLSGYSEAEIRTAIADPDQPICVWDVKDNFGFAWWRTTSKAELKLEEFGVSTPGTGAGRAFMIAFLDSLAATGKNSRLWLHVAGDNAGAIRFYERLGFKHASVTPASWHRRKGPVADAVRMEMVLNGSKG